MLHAFVLLQVKPCPGTPQLVHPATAQDLGKVVALLPAPMAELMTPLQQLMLLPIHILAQVPVV